MTPVAGSVRSHAQMIRSTTVLPGSIVLAGVSTGITIPASGLIVSSWRTLEYFRNNLPT
jgi:hypothetical protein